VSAQGLAPEARARVLIDAQLRAAGWWVCNAADLNLIQQPASVVREVRMKRGAGQVDYLLYVDRKIVGVIEAKPEGTTLSGVEWQSAMYADRLSAAQQIQSITVEGRLPFVFEASGSETHFTNGFDPNPRARRLFAFPQPGALARIVRDSVSEPDAATWRGKVQRPPALVTAGLRPAQVTAIEATERSRAEQRFDPSLVQMATGAGKTFVAVTETYGYRRSVSEPDLRLVKSKQRVGDHGEVFTPDWMVEAMLDLVKGETERIESRFLESACGSGNFLAPVLERKFAVVAARYGRSDFEKRHYALLALMSVYGIELLDDNVAECRARLLALYTDFLRAGEDDWVPAGRAVLAANIVHGDALSMLTREADPKPIVLPEWAYLGKGRFQRRDFRFDVLTKMSSFGEETLFGDIGKHELFVPVKSYPALLVGDIADQGEGQ
jgi:hypothetical protein